MAASDDSRSRLARSSRQPLLRRGSAWPIARLRRANTPETPFTLSSVSKMFTAVTSRSWSTEAVVVRQPRSVRCCRITLRRKPGSGDGGPPVDDELGHSGPVPCARILGRDQDHQGAARLLELLRDVAARVPARHGGLTATPLPSAGRDRRAADLVAPFTAVVADVLFHPLDLARTSSKVDPVPEARAQGPRAGLPRPASRADRARWHPAWAEAKPGDDFLPRRPDGQRLLPRRRPRPFPGALVGNRILNRDTTARVLTGYIDADYGGRDGYGFETRLVNGVRTAGHSRLACRFVEPGRVLSGSWIRPGRVWATQTAAPKRSPHACTCPVDIVSRDLAVSSKRMPNGRD